MNFVTRKQRDINRSTEISTAINHFRFRFSTTFSIRSLSRDREMLNFDRDVTFRKTNIIIAIWRHFTLHFWLIDPNRFNRIITTSGESFPPFSIFVKNVIEILQWTPSTSREQFVLACKIAVCELDWKGRRKLSKFRWKVNEFALEMMGFT